MSLLYAKLRLAEWGRWSKDDTLGYPKQSAVLGGVVGRSTGRLAEMPAHVCFVDVIVRQMDVEPRRVLIVHYTQTGTLYDKATRIGSAYGTYRRLLREGQNHVSVELEYEEIQGYSTGRGLAKTNR